MAQHVDTFSCRVDLGLVHETVTESVVRTCRIFRKRSHLFKVLENTILRFVTINELLQGNGMSEA